MVTSIVSVKYIQNLKLFDNNFSIILNIKILKIF